MLIITSLCFRRSEFRVSGSGFQISSLTRDSRRETRNLFYSDSFSYTCRQASKPPLMLATFVKPFSMKYPAAPRLLRSEEHTSELQSRGHLVCRLLLEK